MYVRLNMDRSGNLFLEQLLTFTNTENNKEESKWEKVPVVGVGKTESHYLPLSKACGILMIEEFKSDYLHGQFQDETKNVCIVPALSIVNISEAFSNTNGTRIETNDKRRFFINMPLVNFIDLLTKALSGFMIINVDRDGNILNLKGEIYGKEKQNRKETHANS